MSISILRIFLEFYLHFLDFFTIFFKLNIRKGDILLMTDVMRPHANVI